MLRSRAKGLEGASGLGLWQSMTCVRVSDVLSMTCGRVSAVLSAPVLRVH